MLRGGQLMNTSVRVLASVALSRKHGAGENANDRQKNKQGKYPFAKSPIFQLVL
jgi:hypothetical protein